MKKLSLFIIAGLTVISMITAVIAGFNRLGWYDINTGIGGEHGALMVGSFLGTVILLERAVSSKSKWHLLLPIINGLSMPLFFAEFQQGGLVCLSVGAFGLCYLYLDILSRIKETSFYIMLAGAVCWLIGNVLALQNLLYPIALPWWTAFLMLTIVGERLELSKFLPINRMKKQLLISLLVIAVIALGFFFHSYGQVIGGLAICAISIWLLKFDMVRKSIFKKGLHQYSAFTLGIGYFWLGAYGILLCMGGFFDISYDTLVHAFFIGFVINMIFAHAPIILPGVARLNFYPYHPVLYVWVTLLQLSLFTRVLGSEFGIVELRYYGGMLNGLFIFTFFLTMVTLVIRKKLIVRASNNVKPVIKV